MFRYIFLACSPCNLVSFEHGNALKIQNGCSFKILLLDLFLGFVIVSRPIIHEPKIGWPISILNGDEALTEGLFFLWKCDELSIYHSCYLLYMVLLSTMSIEITSKKGMFVKNLYIVSTLQFLFHFTFILCSWFSTNGVAPCTSLVCFFVLLQFFVFLFLSTLLIWIIYFLN